jgi:hypothetical protein
MPSSDHAATRALLLALAVGAGALWATPARAQQTPQGFAVERFNASAPGGGWFVMDDLSMRGSLGGAIAVTGGYASNPLRVASTDGTQRLTVVSGQSFADVGIALTLDRYRLYMNIASPVEVSGGSGVVGAYSFTAPAVSPMTDIVSDVRIGFDARFFGGPHDAFRLGAGAQLLVPSGDRADYVTDGTYRAMGRLLFAGDVGLFAYAGHVGIHVRPLDDGPAPGSPQGSELLFGAAAGPRFPVDAKGTMMLVVGPEVFGATALRSFFGETTTALEGLMSARLEGTGNHGPQLRFKLGAGGGLDAHFGAPDGRVLFGFEVFDHNVPAPPPVPPP